MPSLTDLNNGAQTLGAEKPITTYHAARVETFQELLLAASKTCRLAADFRPSNNLTTWHINGEFFALTVGAPGNEQRCLLTLHLTETQQCVVAHQLVNNRSVSDQELKDYFVFEVRLNELQASIALTERYRCLQELGYEPFWCTAIDQALKINRYASKRVLGKTVPFWTN